MKFESFRSQLLEAAPSLDALLSLGLSRKEAEGFILTFQLLSKDSEVQNYDESNAIESFFSLYDPSNLEIGMVRFSKVLNDGQDFYSIGQVESDPLLIDKKTASVYVRDITLPSRILWVCADNIEHFLLALIPVARYLGLCLVDSDIRDNQELAKTALSESVMAAGGEKYTDFYRMLLGI